VRTEIQHKTRSYVAKAECTKKNQFQHRGDVRNLLLCSAQDTFLAAHTLPMSYAAAAARGIPLAVTHNAQSVKQPSAQTQCEVIMNIRDPLTTQSLRAMNPGNLTLHIQRAIEQSGNKNIASVKIVSSNQLKSGDLSIKTASSSEVEALRQFADDWAHRIGSGTTVQIPTFGVLVHGIRTSTMDMSKLDEIRAQILQDNRPLIPRAKIRHVGWLTRDASNGTATTITIELTVEEPLCGDDTLSVETSLLSMLPSRRGGRGCLGVLLNRVAHKGELYCLTLIVVLPPPSPAVPSPG
jgi:hypothetical protein